MDTSIFVIIPFLFSTDTNINFITRFTEKKIFCERRYDNCFIVVASITQHEINEIMFEILVST